MLEKYDTMFEDKETVVNFCPYHTEDWAEVYTTDKQVMRHYEKFIGKYPAHCKLVKEDKYSMTFSIDPKCAGVFPHAPRTRIMTEEQREANRKLFVKNVMNKTQE